MRRGSLDDLTAFVAGGDQLSFRTAASRLGLTPSALSPQDAAAGGAPSASKLRSVMRVLMSPGIFQHLRSVSVEWLWCEGRP